MFSIFKKNEADGVPEWASFFTIKEYTKFLKELNSYFEKKGIAIKLEDGAINFEEENEFDLTTAGIANLAQNCKPHNRSYYKEVIRLHFDSLLNMHKTLAAKNIDNSDFNQVSKYLAFRVHHASYLNHLDKEATVGFHFREDLFALMVYDFPEVIESVQNEDFERWGKSLEEVFIRAFQNVLSNYEFKVTKQSLDNVDFYSIITDHLFSSTVFFDIENRPELIGIHGSIICFPHRHTTLIYPIDNMYVSKIIAHLALMTHGMYIEGPGSISRKMYWYIHGELNEIQYAIGEDNSVTITPSEQFLDMLNGIGDNEVNQQLN